MKAEKILLIVAWLVSFQLSAVQAQTLVVKTYKVTVKGTSSLHDWESVVDKLEMKGSYSIVKNNLSDVRDVLVSIPVKAIKSTKGKLMDNKTWEAFDYEKNPLIVFTLTGRQISTSNNTLDVAGTITMAGVSKPANLHLSYKCLPGGDLKITGQHTLRMTDFGMQPPTAMMGTIKVGDEVTLGIEISLGTNNSL